MYTHNSVLAVSTGALLMRISAGVADHYREADAGDVSIQIPRWRVLWFRGADGICARFGIPRRSRFLYAGLDQFGPHSRIISPWQVVSEYNFVRGGDIDEIRIYDRMLPTTPSPRWPRAIAPPDFRRCQPAMLADAPLAGSNGGCATAGTAPMIRRRTSRHADGRAQGRDPRRLRPETLVVEGHDGIRETTWPGVYNRSRLPGRNDYFQLPDWDCYVESGKSITFVMPDEPWNHLEISGAAWGRMDLLKPNAANDGPAESVLFERPQGPGKNHSPFCARRSSARKSASRTSSRRNRSANSWPTMSAPGHEPAGSAKLTYWSHRGVPADEQPRVRS